MELKNYTGDTLIADNKCAACEFMAIRITKNGLQPDCKKNKHKFKERKRVDWQHDKDLNEKSCKLFKPHNEHS